MSVTFCIFCCCRVANVSSTIPTFKTGVAARRLGSVVSCLRETVDITE